MRRKKKQSMNRDRKTGCGEPESDVQGPESVAKL